jgi:flagellar biosynthesis protein FlhG
VTDEGASETHYAVLGLEPRASRDQVEKAYRFCLEMYREGSLATYSLLQKDEIGVIRGRIAQAYEVLSDPGRRREYDLSIGVAGAMAPLLPFPPTATPLSMPRVAQPATLEPAAEGEPGALAAAEPATPLPVTTAPAAPPPPVLPEHVTGQELRRIREGKGVSLREIALVSKVGVRFLEYIEEDRVALLPAPVYLRGFLMEYGRALGLDPRRTAEAYMANLP